VIVLSSVAIMKTDDVVCEKSKVDFKEILKERLRVELKEDLKDDMKKELKKELKNELKEELKEELKNVILGEESEDDRTDSDFPWLVFDINGTEYGINSKYVLSIEKLNEVTPIIEAPDYCPGVTLSRGEMIELLDLRALFGIGDYTCANNDGNDAHYMMVVIDTGDMKRGLNIDRIVAVEEIMQFMPGVIGEEEGELAAKYISQIALREKYNSPVLILNADALIAL